MPDVYVSPEARADAFAIYEFIRDNAGTEAAQRIIDGLDEIVMSLRSLPLRGKLPPEMQSAGVYYFRELQFPPWRIFYQVKENRVDILAILDGRRNIAQILPQRLAKAQD